MKNPRKKLSILLFLLTFHLVELLQIKTIELLCSRIYFDHAGIETFPYAPLLNAVYIKSNEIKSGFPVYEHERGGMYFQYNRILKMFYFAAEIDNFNSAVIKIPQGRFTTLFDIESKISQNKKGFPLGGVLDRSKAQYFYRAKLRTKEWSNYVSLTPKCVKYSRCQTGEIIFTNKDNSRDVSKYSYYKLVPNVYNENRPLYESQFNHLNTNHKEYLYYKEGFWCIGYEKFSRNANFKARSTALYPEYILEQWKLKSFYGWDIVEKKITCKSLNTFPSSCDLSPCSRYDTCNLNSLNEPFCVCRYGSKGKTCEYASATCPNELFPFIDNEIGAIAVKFYDVNAYIINICNNYRTWYSLATQTTDPLLESDFWKYFIGIVTVLIFFLPCCHWAWCKCQMSCLTIYSVHWYLGLVLWLIFIICYYMIGLTKYGEENFTNILYCAIAFTCLFYLFMLIESFCSSEYEYVMESEDCDDIKELVNKIHSNKPIIIIHGEAYHYETKTRTVSYRDSDGHSRTRTETYKEKVTTWTGSETFLYQSCRDISNLSELPSLENIIKCQRIKFHKEIKYANEESARAFEQFKSEFCRRNERLDVEFRSNITEEIPDFKERVLAYSETEGKPFWMNSCCFCLSIFCLVSWPYRILLKSSTNKQEFTFIKQLSVTNSLQEHSAILNNSITNVETGQISYQLQDMSPSNEVQVPLLAKHSQPHPPLHNPTFGGPSVPQYPLQVDISVHQYPEQVEPSVPQYPFQGAITIPQYPVEENNASSQNFNPPYNPVAQLPTMQGAELMEAPPPSYSEVMANYNEGRK